MSLPSINFLHLMVADIARTRFSNSSLRQGQRSNQGQNMTLHTYAPQPMSLPSMNFLHLTVSEIQPGQTISRCPPAHPDTMGENNTPIALKGCGVKRPKMASVRYFGGLWITFNEELQFQISACLQRTYMLCIPPIG